MDLIKKYCKYGLNGLLFIFALVGLIKGCIISGAVLLVLAVLSLPIPQMQTLVEKFLEDSFKQVSEKQPNLTLEQFKKSQKNIFVIFCVIFSLFILFSENENTNTNVQKTVPAQQLAPEYKINIASETAYKTFTDKDGVLNKGYTLKGNLYQTKSRDFENVYIFGALVEQNGQIYNCLWANKDVNADGMFDSINNHAVAVSGIISSKRVTMSDDGVAKINQRLLEDLNNMNKPAEISITPNNACDYLKSQNFVTEGYKSDGMGGYFCATPYKMLDGKSNLAYYVDGTQNDVEKLSLVLNVYNGTNKVMLHEQLANNAKVLAKQALNYDLTVDNINAIKNGINTNFKVTDNWSIEVFNENWVTGLGSETQFIIKK